MTQTAVADPTDADLARLGIERIATFTYRVGTYRYSNLADAMFAAHRANKQ